MKTINNQEPSHLFVAEVGATRNKVVVVNENDEFLRLEDKTVAHLGGGILHRAFMTLLFNQKKQLLICQRSTQKMLWPFFWGDSCASHPCENESMEEAGERRLYEELGIRCSLREVQRFQYRAKFQDVGSEYELCGLLAGSYDGGIDMNPSEVAAFEWLDISTIVNEIKSNSEKFTPWFILGLEKYFAKNDYMEE